jgi:hypothetical protein
LPEAYTMAARHMRNLSALSARRRRPAALFLSALANRTAECAVNTAKNSYETLLRNFTEGVIGIAAYRLAALYYQEKNYSVGARNVPR